MPEAREIVINTGPLIALVAAVGDLEVLRQLYERVLVPYEVGAEVLAPNKRRFAALEFDAASWLEKKNKPIALPPQLKNVLGAGEAAVVQWALTEHIPLVCIDETVGRRTARVSGLRVTGSLGVLLRAKREGFPVAIAQAVQAMRKHGIWLSDAVADLAVREAGEG